MFKIAGLFKLLPIYCIWVGIGMDIIDPGTVGRVTVGANLYQVDFSYQLFINGLLGLDITLSLPALMTKLVNYATCLHRITNSIVFIHGQGEPFLRINMLPCFCSINGHLRMPVVWRSDNDGIDIVSGEQVPVIFISFGSRPRLTSCTFTSNIGCSSHCFFGMYIKEVAYSCYMNIKIVLFLEIRVPLILGIFGILVLQFLYRIRMCKSSSFHKLCSTNSITYNTDPDGVSVMFIHLVILFFSAHIELPGQFMVSNVVLLSFSPGTISHGSQYWYSGQTFEHIPAVHFATACIFIFISHISNLFLIEQKAVHPNDFGRGEQHKYPKGQQFNEVFIDPEVASLGGHCKINPGNGRVGEIVEGQQDNSGDGCNSTEKTYNQSRSNKDQSPHVYKIHYI